MNILNIFCVCICVLNFRSLKFEPRNNHIIIAFEIPSCVFIYLYKYFQTDCFFLSRHHRSFAEQ